MVKIKVTEECIGCGVCIDMCPEVFFLGDDGFAHVIEEGANNPDLAEKVQESAAACPTEAIEIEG